MAKSELSSLVLRVVGDTRDAVGELQDLKREVKGTQKSVGSIARTMGTFALRAGGVAAAVGASAAALRSFVDRGSTVDGVLFSLGRRVGNADAALESMSRATLGLVDNTELATQANRALQLGAADNVEEFNKLASAAISLGSAMGLDATFALNKMVAGIARQSTLLLDDIGITVDAIEAQRKYAAQLGKTRQELTANERAEAFRLEVLRNIDAAVANVGEASRNNATRFATIVNHFKNMADEAARAANASGLLSSALDDIGQAIGAIPDVTRLEFGETIGTLSLQQAVQHLSDAQDEVAEIQRRMRDLRQRDSAGARAQLEDEADRLAVLFDNMRALRARIRGEATREGRAGVETARSDAANARAAEATRQLQAAQEGLAAATEGLSLDYEALAPEVVNFGVQTTSTAEDVAKARQQFEASGAMVRDMKTQFVDAAVTIGMNFRSMGDVITSVLKRVAIEMAASKLFDLLGISNAGAGKFFNKQAKNQGGGGGLFGNLVGGVLGSIPGLGFFSGLFDRGGMIPRGGFGVVGERGPEIVTGPAQVVSRRDTAALAAGGQGATINLTLVTADTGRVVDSIRYQTDRDTARGREVRLPVRAMVMG